MKDWFGNNKRRIFISFGIVAILLVLPLTLLLVRQTQNLRSSAAAPDKIETEAGVLSGTVQTLSDSLASGGQYVKFGTSAQPTQPPNPSGVGTGGTFSPKYVNVTGGGPMPSTSGGINAKDYGAKGDGVNDDTAELQTAAKAARDAGKPLLIPKTNAYYKISGPINIYGSVIGINGMPTIKQTNTAKDSKSSILWLRDGMTGWIYNLKLISHYNGQYFNYRDKTYPGGEGGALIRINDSNGLTIKGNILENAWGDGVFDAWGPFTNNPATNILIDNNTFKNNMRTAIAVTTQADGWAIMNNKIIHASSYVNPVDFEPNGDSDWVVNMEIGYNEYQITSPYEVNLFTGWFDPTPGGNIWVYNNYGSWTGTFTKEVGLKGAPSTWFNVNVFNNNKTN